MILAKGGEKNNKAELFLNCRQLFATFFSFAALKCCVSGVVEVTNAEAKWVEHWKLPENY